MLVSITDDFDLQKIAESGQCFRVRQMTDGRWFFLTVDKAVCVVQKGNGQYEVSCTEKEWNTLWKKYFDLNRNYCALRQAVPEEESFLKNATEVGAGLRILRQDPWEMLLTFIISQQKTIPSIRAAVELLSERFGERIVTEYGVFFLFPTPKQLSCVTEEELRSLRLGYRAPYLLDAIQKVNSGVLDLESLSHQTDEELFQSLKTVKGVGNKVANCVALFGYGRVALAPVDTWIKKVIAQKYEGKNPFPRYGETAGIMQQYIFYYAQKNKAEFS